MKTTAKERLQSEAVRICKILGSAYDVAKLLNTDYSNVCKFYRDHTKMPISKALQIIDYTGSRIVVFNNNL